MFLMFLLTACGWFGYPSSFREGCEDGELLGQLDGAEDVAGCNLDAHPAPPEGMVYAWEVEGDPYAHAFLGCYNAAWLVEYEDEHARCEGSP